VVGSTAVVAAPAPGLESAGPEFLLAAAGDPGARERLHRRLAPLAYVAAVVRLRDARAAAEASRAVIDLSLSGLRRDPVSVQEDGGGASVARRMEEAASTLLPLPRSLAAARYLVPESAGGGRSPAALAGALSPAQRSVVLLHFLFDMPLADVAGVLGIPPAEAVARFTAALARLRDLGFGRAPGPDRPGPLPLRV
jgi:hypothetical protein